MSMDNLLKKATTDDENPTPGYVFTELAKITHGDPSTCEKMAEWLVNRLKRNEPAVKWKVLLVMKHVAKGGRLEFRRALQRHNEAVKACSQFRGPPDPLRGNEPYTRVHTAAKDALEAMFDSTPPPSISSSQLGNRITSMSGGSEPSRFPPPASGGSGSGGYPPAASRFPPAASSAPPPASGFSTALPGQPGYDPNSPLHAPPVTSGTMQGFGNYDPNKDKGNSVFDKLKSAFTTTTTPPMAGRPGAPAPSAGGYGGPRPGGVPPPEYGGGYGGSSSSGAASYAGGASGGSTGFGSATDRQRGAPGGGWGASAAPAPAAAAGPGPQGMGRRGHMPPGTAGAGGNNGTYVGVPGRVGGAAKDGGYERGLVEDLTAPGGVRPVPDKDKLASFLQAMKTLDMAVVGRLLDERVAHALPDQDSSGGSGANIAGKALAVMEAVATTPGMEAQKTYLAEHCDVLLDVLEGAEKASLKQATYRTLRALGVDVEEPAGLVAAAPAAAPSPYSTPAPAPAAAPVAAPAPAPAPRAPEPDLFGLDFGAPAPAPAVSAFPMAAAAPASAPAASGLDMFSFGAAPAPAPAPAAAVSGLAGMFGGLSVSGGAAAAPAAPTGFPAMFPAAAPAPAVAPAASGFSFPGMAAAPAPAPVAAPAPAPVPAAMPAMGMPQAAPAAAQLQQQLMMVQQQVQAMMMQMAANPGMAQAMMPQLMQMQQMQTQLQLALMSAQSQPMAGGMPGMFPGAASTTAAAVPMGGMGMQMGMSGGAAAPGGFGGMPGMAMQPAAAAPAPGAAPAKKDIFDFASAGLF